jgi:hypothetical protein
MKTQFKHLAVYVLVLGFCLCQGSVIKNAQVYQAQFSSDDTPNLLKTEYGKIWAQACDFFKNNLNFPCNSYLTIPIIKLFNFMGPDVEFQKLAFLLTIKISIFLNINQNLLNIPRPNITIKRILGRSAEYAYKNSIFLLPQTSLPTREAKTLTLLLYLTITTRHLYLTEKNILPVF